MIQIPLSLGFDQVAIVPQKNICMSRLDAKIESEIIRGIKRPLPIISSNMDSVTNADFAIKMFKAGGLGILHRAWVDNNDYLSAVTEIAKQCPLVASSIGVGESAFALANQLVRYGVNIICIDVANAYSDVAIDLGKK